MNKTSNTSLAVGFLDTEFSPKVPILQALLIVIFAAATIVCNCALILAVLRTPLLHTKTNTLLISFAVSELLLGVCVMPFIAATLFKRSLRFSSTFCDFTALMSSLCRSSKSLSMLGVSVDRCIAISHPLQYTGCITRTTTVLLVTLAWLTGLLFAVLPLFGVGTQGYIVIFGRCMVDLHLSPVFAMTKELICTVAPSTAILIMFTVVIMEARSHHRVTTIAQLAIAMYSGPAGGLRGINYARSTFKALRTYIIISCIYLCTVFPESVYMVLVAGKAVDSSSFLVFFNFLTYLCSFSTPLIITTLNVKFRQSVATLCTCKNKVSPVTDHEPYTISTGLQTILEHSMVLPSAATNRDLRRPRGSSRDEAETGVTRRTPVVKFTPRKVSVLQEVQSSSSGELILPIHKSQQFVLRKSSSTPS